MNYYKYLLISLLPILFTACHGQDNSKVVATDRTTAMIEVIDFYGTHRCVTCEAIEANAKYTVDTYYAKEKAAGKVVFKTVNIDEEDNYAMAERFEASGTALFINVVKDGQETHLDLTNFAFSKGRDQEAFSQELKTRIDAELIKL